MSLFTRTSSWHDEAHELYADTVQRFLAAELVPNIVRYVEQGEVDRSFWQKAGQAGLMAGSVPEDYGGAGGGPGFDAITLYQQATTSDTSWGFAIQAIVIHYLITFGSDEQKATWLTGLAAGDVIGALAMTEPGCGSDVQSIRTYASRQTNFYRINGNKLFITNGRRADLIILATKTDIREGARGISLILVDATAAEGLSRGRHLDKLGMRGNDTADLTFDDVEVPLANLLGPEEGQGFYQMMHQPPLERLLIAVGALGAIDCALSSTIRFVKERHAFGQRIMDFQNTRFRLAEMKTRAEILRSFVNDCIALLERGELDGTRASMAKYWASEIQNEIVDGCLQLHGGYGYIHEYPIARLYADARVQKIYGGTNEIMKELIARSLDSH